MPLRSTNSFSSFFADVSSIHPYDRPSARTVLVSPSDFDHQFWTELFCKNLEAAEGHLESFKSKYGTEKLDDRRQVAFRNLQGRISMYKEQLKLYNTLVRTIGPVFSRSGFEMRGGRASDWALFYLPSDRLFDNEVFSISFPTSLLEYIVSFVADNFQATKC